MAPRKDPTCGIAKNHIESSSVSSDAQRVELSREGSQPPLDRPNEIRGGARGPYRITAALGVGSTATVFRDIDASDVAVALNLLNHELMIDADLRERFVQEPQLSPKHPRIVEAFDSGLHEGIPYYAMRLMSGSSLAERPSRRYVRWILALGGVVLAAVAELFAYAMVRPDGSNSVAVEIPRARPLSSTASLPVEAVPTVASRTQRSIIQQTGSPSNAISVPTVTLVQPLPTSSPISVAVLPPTTRATPLLPTRTATPVVISANSALISPLPGAYAPAQIVFPKETSNGVEARVVATGYERWGRPLGMDGRGSCYSYDDIRPLMRLKVTLQVSNQFGKLVNYWFPSFVTTSGVYAYRCPERRVAGPGPLAQQQERTMTFSVYMESTEKISYGFAYFGDGEVLNQFAVPWSATQPTSSV